MYRTATYWPVGSWETERASRGLNVAVQIQALWCREHDILEVYLQVDVAEGGYLYDGVSYQTDPRQVDGAHRIDLFLSHPDLRTLKQVRRAILSRAEVKAESDA